MAEEDLNVFVEETECPPEYADFFSCVFCKKSLIGKSEDILGSRLLICCHSICSSCAESWNEETKTCPTCHCVLPNDLLENKILQELVAQPLPEGILKGVCFEHKNIKTTKWCNECSTLVCDACIENHKTLMVIRSHTIIDVKDTVPNANKTLATLQCHQHPSCKLDRYCEMCNIITCRDCQLEVHKWHPYQYLSDSKACVGFRKDLLNKRCRLEQTDKTLELSIEAIKHLKIDNMQQWVDVRKTVNEIFSKITESIHARRDEVLNQLHSYFDKDIGKLDHDLKETESLVSPLKHCISIFNLIVNSSSDVALLYSKKHLEKCCKHVLGKNVKVYNQDIIRHINFNPGNDVDLLLEGLRSFGKLEAKHMCNGPRDLYRNLLLDFNTVSSPTPAIIKVKQDLQQPSQIHTETISKMTQGCSKMPLWHIPQKPSTSKPTTIVPVPVVSASTVPVPVVSASTVPDPVANSSFNASLAQMTLSLPQELMSSNHLHTTTPSVPTISVIAMPGQAFLQRVSAGSQSPENRDHFAIIPIQSRSQGQQQVRPLGQGQLRPLRQVLVRLLGQGQVRPLGQGQVKPLGQGQVRPLGQRQVRPLGEAQQTQHQKPQHPFNQ